MPVMKRISDLEKERPPRYIEEDWEAYEKGLELGEDDYYFMPNPEEIQYRVHGLRWLRDELKLPRKWVDSIMRDCPTLEKVEEWVEELGLEKTKKRLSHWLDTKDDEDRKIH